jgi:dephospho-CoA kinase
MKKKRERRSPVIGVTGGVGSGKTAFARELERLGAKVLDADRIARRLVDEDQPVREGLRKAFGAGVFDASGNLKRSELAERVFSDPAQLQLLNGVIWPAMIRVIETAIREHRESDDPAPLVVDMAVLYEAGCERLFDAVVAVEAPLEKRVQRLSVSRGWDETNIRRRMSSQMDVREKSQKADWTVQNDGTLHDLALKAHTAYREILHRSDKGRRFPSRGDFP